MELAKIINKGDSPVIMRHDIHGDVTIAPGKERIVSIDHVIVNLGNPGARNEGKNKVRDADFAALRTRWGFYPGIYPEDAWKGTAPMKDSGEMVGPFCPNVEVYDLDENRIYTILDDPTGEQGRGEFVLTQEAQDAGYLNKRIERLEAQLAQAITLLTNQQQPAVPVPGVEQAPEQTMQTAEQAQQLPVDIGTQAERNEIRDDIPAAKVRSVTKDSPKTTRVGAPA